MSEFMPKIIKDVGLDFNWSEKKVWVPNEPVTENADFKREHSGYLV